MNRRSAALRVLFLGVVLIGCDGRQEPVTAPTLPSPVIQPSNGSSSSANWTGAAVVTAVTIRRNTPCGWGTAPGEARDGVLWLITIDGKAITLDEDMSNWPTDDIPYKGTLDGNRFAAVYESRADYMSYVCQFKGGTITGTFSADGSQFEAVETLMWGAAGVETTVERQWSGRRS